jgi:hypothetical protein
VPRVELPPEMSLTLQVTALDAGPETTAANCCDWPTSTVALEGSTVTVVAGDGPVDEPEVSPHPAKAIETLRASGRMNFRRNEIREGASSMGVFERSRCRRGDSVFM